MTGNRTGSFRAQGWLASHVIFTIAFWAMALILSPSQRAFAQMDPFQYDFSLVDSSPAPGVATSLILSLVGDSLAEVDLDFPYDPKKLEVQSTSWSLDSTMIFEASGLEIDVYLISDPPIIHFHLERIGGDTFNCNGEALRILDGIVVVEVDDLLKKSTHLSKPEMLGLTLSPNPVTSMHSEVMVRCDCTPSRVEVRDITGQLIYGADFASVSLDTEHFPPGIYQVMLLIPEGKVCKRLLKL